MKLPWTPVEPEDAATVILLRDLPEGLEVYMTRRRDELKFLGGYHVFPGGKVDASDMTGEVCARCRGLDPESALRSLQGVADPSRAMGFWAAVARELFEEAEVLLAEDEQGRAVQINDSLRALRVELQEDKKTLTEVLAAENLFLSLGRVYWFAHWITPALSPRRFSTFFFVALCPEGQEPHPFDREISDAAWVRPEEALQLWKKREWDMIPPTIASLDTIARYSSFSALEKDFRKSPEEHQRTVWKGGLFG